MMISAEVEYTEVGAIIGGRGETNIRGNDMERKEMLCVLLQTSEQF